MTRMECRMAAEEERITDVAEKERMATDGYWMGIGRRWKEKEGSRRPRLEGRMREVMGMGEDFL